jgi:hypothetical protein
MNRPWLYVNELLPRFSDTRITADSLERRLKEAYPYIDVLEKLAKVHGVDVLEAFEGQQVGAFTVLSPSRAFYLDLLVESLKTPDAKDVAPAQSIRTQFLGLAAPDIELVQEEWGKESLKEGGVTRPDNETSIVQFANFEGRHINLNGDAGIRALISSADYLERMLERIPRPQFMQIPHHGSRRNVAPSVLNRWLGLPILEGEPFRTTAFVSAGKGSSKHPRKAVVNAFMRRGAKVCKNVW